MQPEDQSFVEDTHARSANIRFGIQRDILDERVDQDLRLKKASNAETYSTAFGLIKARRNALLVISKVPTAL
jgi:hypothetical protein